MSCLFFKNKYRHCPPFKEKNWHAHGPNLSGLHAHGFFYGSKALAHPNPNT